jgi:predicted protein tyrosine phosphatase
MGLLAHGLGIRALLSSKVRIYGREELVRALKRSSYERTPFCISIGNPGDALEDCIGSAFEKVLRLEFFDHDGPVDSDTRIRPIRNLDILKLLLFFRETVCPEASYTVQGTWGVSRSPAIALAVLFLIHGSPGQALETVKAIRPDAKPSESVLSLVDRALGSGFLSLLRRGNRHSAFFEARTRTA